MQPDENDEDLSAGEEGQPTIEIPQAPTFPPPPEVQFTRPTLGRAAPGRAFSRPDSTGNLGQPADQQGSDGSSGGGSHLGAGLVIGVMFPSCVIVGALIGAWIDNRWPAASPWGIVVMSLAGIAAGFINIFRMIGTIDRPNKKK